MGNCKIYKFNGVDINDNLVAIGNFRIKVKAATIPSGQEHRQYINIAMNNYGGTTKLKVVKGNGHISFEQNDITYTELTLNGSERKPVWFENTDFEVEVENKYKIRYISVASLFSSNSIAGMSIDDLQFISNPMERLVLNGNNWNGDIKNLSNAINSSSVVSLYDTAISGDIEVFRDKATVGADGNFILGKTTGLYGDITALNSINATKIDVQSTNISGNISSFANSAVTRLEARYSKISGTIEGFATSMKTVKNAGDIVNIMAVGTSVTYQGSAVNSEYKITFTSGDPVIETV